MKKLIITIFLLLSVYAYAADYSVKAGENIFVPIEVPKGKIGGGDFYNLKIESASGKIIDFQYKSVENGIDIQFSKAGVYSLLIMVDHVTKSSCAGVNVDTYLRRVVIFDVK